MNDFYIFQDVSFEDEVPVKYYLSSIEDTWAHWHKEIEIIFLLSGELQITVDDTKHELKADDIILINSNQIHSIKGNNDLTYVLHIIPEVISRIHGSDELHHFNLNTIGVSLERKSFDSIKYILAKIGIELTKRKEGYQFFLWSYVYELLGHIFRQCPYEVVKNGSKSEDLVKISSIINYITDNHTKSLSISNIAEALNMSDLTLSKFFKEKTGLSILFYIQIVRIDHAKLLLKSDASIIDIAQECGFYSLPTFYRAFKKVTGLSPNEFRSSRAHSAPGNNTETLIYSGVPYTDDYDLLYKYLYPILRKDPIYP
jgi:xylan 1,4-beta-xylosidase